MLVEGAGITGWELFFCLSFQGFPSRFFVQLGVTLLSDNLAHTQKGRWGPRKADVPCILTRLACQPFEGVEGPGPSVSHTTVYCPLPPSRMLQHSLDPLGTFRRYDAMQELEPVSRYEEEGLLRARLPTNNDTKQNLCQRDLTTLAGNFEARCGNRLMIQRCPVRRDEGGVNEEAPRRLRSPT